MVYSRKSTVTAISNGTHKYGVIIANNTPLLKCYTCYSSRRKKQHTMFNKIWSFFKTIKQTSYDIQKHPWGFECILVSRHNPIIIHLIDTRTKSHGQLIDGVENDEYFFLEEKTLIAFREKFSLNTNFYRAMLIDPNPKNYGKAIVERKNYLQITTIENQRLIELINLKKLIGDSLQNKLFYIVIKKAPS